MDRSDAQLAVAGELRAELRRVHPGFVDTPMVANAPATFRQASLDVNPLGILGAPEDVAHLVVYLISDESGYVSGAEISVDGGQVGQAGVK